MSEKHSEWELLKVAREEKWSILDILLNSIVLFGYDINERNDEGSALIHILAAKNANLLEKVIEKGANVNLVNLQGKTALHVAVEEGNPRAVLDLVKDRADQNIKDVLGETPIFNAVRLGHYEIVRHLIKTGAFASATNNEGCNLLHLAAENDNQTEIIKLLLASGTKVNHSDHSGVAPLHIAVAIGNCKAAELLITGGASIDSGGSRQSLLHDAIQKQKLLLGKPTQMVELLIEAGINIDCRDDSKETPLHLAVQTASLEIFQLLLDKGACVNLTDEDGYAPLHVACNGQKSAFADALLASGALINLQTSNGDSPLHRASGLGNLAVAECLLNHDADVNLRNNDGYAPIRLARDNGHLSMVEYLLSRGADINLLDSFNQPQMSSRRGSTATKGESAKYNSAIKSNLPTKIIKVEGRVAGR